MLKSTVSATSLFLSCLVSSHMPRLPVRPCSFFWLGSLRQGHTGQRREAGGSHGERQRMGQHWGGGGASEAEEAGREGGDGVRERERKGDRHTHREQDTGTTLLLFTA